VAGVVWSEGACEFRASARFVIDATADAGLALLAGCEFLAGRPSDGLYQHSSIVIQCLKENLDAGGRKRERYSYTCTSIRVNQEDVAEFSRRSLEASAWLLKENRPGHRLLSPSDRAGIREGRHPLCLRTMTMRSCLLAPEPEPEPVACARAHFDTNVSDIALESEPFQDWMSAAGMWDFKVCLRVPRGALIPKGVKGLLLAGRHLGVDHDIGHALRMNSAMCCLGQAAGALAALAAKSGVDPEGVPYGELLPHLALPDMAEALRYEASLWNLSAAGIEAALATKTPGPAIWSLYKNCELSLAFKLFATAPPASPERRNAAIAMALLGCEEDSLPCLRELAAKGDAVAVYLLGRFKDAASAPLFAGILNGSYDAPLAAQAFVALLKCAEAVPESRPFAFETLKPLCENPAWTLAGPFMKCHPDLIVRHDVVYRLYAASAFERWGLPHRIGETMAALEGAKKAFEFTPRVI
jgi:hypothetical protein